MSTPRRSDIIESLNNRFQKDPKHRTSDLATEPIHPPLNPLRNFLLRLDCCHASDQNHTTWQSKKQQPSKQQKTRVQWKFIDFIIFKFQILGMFIWLKDLSPWLFRGSSWSVWRHRIRCWQRERWRRWVWGKMQVLFVLLCWIRWWPVKGYAP